MSPFIKQGLFYNVRITPLSPPYLICFGNLDSCLSNYLIPCIPKILLLWDLPIYNHFFKEILWESLIYRHFISCLCLKITFESHSHLFTHLHHYVLNNVRLGDMDMCSTFTSQKCREKLPFLPLSHQWEWQGPVSNGSANHKWGFLWLIHTQSCFIFPSHPYALPVLTSREARDWDESGYTVPHMEGGCQLALTLWPQQHSVSGQCLRTSKFLKALTVNPQAGLGYDLGYFKVEETKAQWGS